MIGMSVQPMFWSAVDYFKDGGGVWENQLPIGLWYPFDALAMPIYPVIYVTEICFLLAATFFVTAPVAILGTVTILICLQFRRCAHKFRSIEFGDYPKDLVSMADAIRYHNRVLEICSMVQEVFSAPLFNVFLISSSVICIFLFMGFHEEDTFYKLQYFVNVVSAILFCVFNAYFGNALIEHVRGF